MNYNLKVVAISGGAGLIGSTIVKELLNKNFKLLIGDINKKKINILKKKIKKKNVIFYTGDLSKKKNIDEFIKLGKNNFKKIDVAINCAYPGTRNINNTFEKLNEKTINKNLVDHLGGAIIFSQRFLNYFTSIKKGNLINFASIFGFNAPKFNHYKNTNMTSPVEYSAIKSGIISMTKYMAKYYKGKNIKINCISPGGIKSGQPEQFVKRYKSSCLSKGLLDSKDIFPLVSFLISDESNYINGQNLIIDDGWSL